MIEFKTNIKTNYTTFNERKKETNNNQFISNYVVRSETTRVTVNDRNSYIKYTSRVITK